MDTYKPLVSIVIPAYNASNYLAEAIDSALSQTYPNIEIIVVNDGSDDDGATAAVAARYGDSIRYFEKENGGSSSAMNFGISQMKGEWFSWLSHDDVYFSNKICAEIDYLNGLDIDYEDKDELQKHIFFASADLIDGKGRTIKKFSKRNIKKTDIKINRPQGSLFLIAEPIQAGFHGCSCLIHRKTFEKVGGFDEKLRLLNDMDLWFRLYSNGYKIHYLPMVLVKGRVHAQQVSRSIGFSYHNPEQDFFWNRNLKWLEYEYPTEYALFYLYGKTAYKKTRYEDGDKAFNDAVRICPRKKVLLKIVKWYCVLLSRVNSIRKALYLKIKT